MDTWTERLACNAAGWLTELTAEKLLAFCQTVSRAYASALADEDDRGPRIGGESSV